MSDSLVVILDLGLKYIRHCVVVAGRQAEPSLCVCVDGDVCVCVCVGGWVGGDVCVWVVGEVVCPSDIL